MPEFPALTQIAWRFLIVAGALVAWFVTQRLIGTRELADGALNDHGHRLTAPWNAWLNSHPRAANALLIGSSLGIDAVTLFVFGYAIFGSNFTPF